MSNRRSAPSMAGNRYCGPMVLATIMGCSTAEAAERVRLLHSNVRAVKGMHNNQVLRTLNRHGWKTDELGGLRMRYISDRKPGKPTVQVDTTMERRDTRRHDVRSYVRFDDTHARLSHMVTYLSGVSGSFRWDAPFTPVKRVGPTLAEWMRTTKRDPDAYYIVQVTGHYVLVKGRKFIDNHTKDWVFLRSAPWRRKRVEHVYKVTAV